MTRLPSAIVTLTDEHRYLGVLLGTLDEQLENIDSAGTGDYFLMQDIVRYMHEYTDEVHHPTEDLMFDRLIRRHPDSAKDVERLRRDHVRLNEQTANIRELLATAADERTPAAADAVRTATTRYIRSLRRHIRIEDADLFPTAVRCLTHEDWQSIEANLEAKEDPLFGGTVGREYRLLYEYFSGRASTLSRQMTRSGYTQLDSLIVSAEALEAGLSDMWDMLQKHAESVVAESRSLADKTSDDGGLFNSISLQAGYAGFLGKTIFDASGDALSIGFRTLKGVAAPLFRRMP